MPVRARASIAPELLSSLRNLIESASGIVLGDAKLPHLSSVVRGRMAALGIPDAPRYMEFLSEGERGAAERRDLVSELLVGETGFFRTPALFQAFEKAILPGLLEQGFVSPLPIWCAGCATGEEAYSVAIAALEGSRGLAAPVRVRATDLHPRFIDAAREGIYPSQALRNLPGRIRETWFTPMKDGRYRVTDAVRRLVDFEEGNLIGFLSDPPPRAVRGDLLPERDDLLPVGHHAPARRAVSRKSLRRGGPLPRALRNVVGDFGGVPIGTAGEDFLLPEAARGGPPAATCRRSPFHRFERRRRRRVPRAEPSPSPPGADASPAMNLVLSAERLADEGRFEEAVAMCRQAAALDPGCPEAEYLMAFLLRGHGRHAEAFYHAERALERDPRFVFADMEAAECLSGMGRTGEASLRWKGILRAIDGEEHLPRLSVGGGDLFGDACANTCFPVCRDESRDESRCGGPFPLR